MKKLANIIAFNIYCYYFNSLNHKIKNNEKIITCYFNSDHNKG